MFKYVFNSSNFCEKCTFTKSFFHHLYDEKIYINKNDTNENIIICIFVLCIAFFLNQSNNLAPSITEMVLKIRKELSRDFNSTTSGQYFQPTNQPNVERRVQKNNYNYILTYNRFMSKEFV